MRKRILFCLLPLLLAACHRGPEPLLGTLEWDRIAVPAEVSEPITQILVKEGDLVEANQLLLTLDSRRIQAQLDSARADEQRLAAALDELRHGARIETIDASRAALARAQATAANARLARDRARRSTQAGAQPQAVTRPTGWVLPRSSHQPRCRLPRKLPMANKQWRPRRNVWIVSNWSASRWITCSHTW